MRTRVTDISGKFAFCFVVLASIAAGVKFDGFYSLGMKTFLTIFHSLPAILQAVQAVEAVIPIPQTGKQKLDLVLNSASAALAAGQAEQQISHDQVLSSIAAITSLTVSTLNATGVFKNSQTTPVSSK